MSTLFQPPRHHDVSDEPEENAPGTLGAFNREAVSKRTDPFGYGATARVNAVLGATRFDGNEIVIDYGGGHDSKIMS